MRFISVSNLHQHPENRKQRFAPALWPSGSNDKEIDEGWTFLEFGQAAGFEIREAPVNRQPPFPDLECVIEGKRALFEFAEILESDLAEGIAYSGQQARKKADAVTRGDTLAAESIQTWGLRSFPANAALERLLRKKLSNDYQTAGIETHLLLYYDQQSPSGPFNDLLQWQDELAILLGRSVFKKIWIFWLAASVVIGYVDVLVEGTLHLIFDQEYDFDIHGRFNAIVPGDGQTPDQVKTFVPVLLTR